MLNETMQLVMEKLTHEKGATISSKLVSILFDLILYVPVSNFQLCQDWHSWVKSVLSKD